MSKKKRKQTKRYKKLLKNEIDKKLNTLETSLKFKRKVMDQVSSLKSLIIDLKKKGKKIAGYGASAKGLIILKCSNIGKKLEYFVDDSPAKQGFYSPVDHTPVISRRDVKTSWLFCDNIFLRDIIIQKERKFIENGGKFIIPKNGVHLYP